MSAVDLSSINRTAMSAKEGYWWINGIALALSAVIASMSWTAYAETQESQRAVACIIAQAVAIAAAILARRAITGQMGVSAIAAALLAGGCAWWASHGIALAWYGDQARNGEPMVLFLAALEPALFLLAEHVKEGREALRTAQEKADREEAEALAVARARDESYRQKSPDARRISQQAGDGATIHRLKVVETAPQPGETSATGDQPAGQPVDELPPLAVPGHSAATFADSAAHARHLITVDGIHRRNELVRQVRGLSSYRASLLLDELAPGWRAKKAAA
jgi:hypothetical protein